MLQDRNIGQMQNNSERLSTQLGRRGYSIDKNKAGELLVEKLKQQLTVKPAANPDFGEPTPFPVWRESDKRLYIPRNFGLDMFGAPYKNKMHTGVDAPRLRFQGQLRDEQREPVEKFLSAARDPMRGGGVLELPTGFGKTSCALYIACALGKRTMVICHKEFLVNQWVERIQQFIPDARIGIVRQKRCEVEGYDIVIASLQSIAMRDYPEGSFDTVGFVIVDEAHHIAAEVFSQALPKVTSAVMLGLSATLRRKDGLTKVIHWFMGNTVHSIRTRKDVTNVEVQVYKYYDPHPEYGREIVLFRDKLCIPKMMNAVCAFAPRNNTLVNEIVRIKKSEPSRVFLILSDRRGHLEDLKYRIDLHNMGTSGYYVGGMRQIDLDETARGCDFIFATNAMAAEGLDIPRLDTLVLATSSADVTQAVGRILRGHGARKVHPLVLDFVDNFSIFQRQFYKRSTYYKRNGYKINFLNDDAAQQRSDAFDAGIELQPQQPKITFRDDE